ncbi:MAG: hypothetical protein HND53_01640 [Proteobacteria bacterium]|nr:hypothetical protein [Pseudomonadota bacterium]NOG59174.1 hypothetical protein [Pseudomonadota bacterium]
MKIELDNENSASNKIISYSDDSFTLKNKLIKSNFVISKDNLIEHWSVDSYQNLALQHMDPIIAWQPEVILLGTGNESGFQNYKLLSYITSKQIGLEIMTTGAACRSYNLLIDEGRHVVACLFLPSN